MTRHELLLAAHLLEVASEEFSNHGCNDFDLSVLIPSTHERRKLIEEYCAWNGDPDDFDLDDEYEFFPDYALMDFLAAKFRKQAEEMSP